MVKIHAYITSMASGLVVFALLLAIAMGATFVLGEMGLFEVGTGVAIVLTFFIGFLVSKVFYEAFRDWFSTIVIAGASIAVLQFFLPIDLTQTVLFFLIGFLVAKAFSEEKTQHQRAARF